MILTGATAALYLNTLRVGRCSNFSLSVSNNILETTKQGDLDKTWRKGIRESSGSFVLFYDPLDESSSGAVNQILSNSSAVLPLKLAFDDDGGNTVEASIIITKVAFSAQTKSAQAVSIDYTVVGAVTPTPALIP